MSEPNRVPPNMPVGAYQTYRIASPLATHWRTGTCAEADCEQYENGWQSTIDETTVLGQRQAHYIRRESGRGFTERREGMLTVFAFTAGQQCFAEHKVPVGRPELYLVRDGDWRGNPTGRTRQHSDAQAWIDDFGEHQDTLADQMKKG
jgi:hypothetical protein